jgi:hypothetical protein
MANCSNSASISGRRAWPSTWHAGDAHRRQGRYKLWKNARNKLEEVKHVVRLIEDCGLPYSEEAALKWNDPIGLF